MTHVSRQSRTKPARTHFHEVLEHLPKRRRRQIGLLFLLMLVGSLSEIVTISAVVPFITLMAQPEMITRYPWLQATFVHLGWEESRSPILFISTIFIGIVALATAVRLLLLYASNKLVYAIGQDIGIKLYRTFLNQPYTFHAARNTGDIIADVNKVQMLLNGLLRPAMEGATALILGISILAALMLVNATVALSAGALFAVIYLAIIRLFRSRLTSNSKVIANTEGKRIRVIQEGLGGIRDVLLDANQNHYAGEFARYEGRFRRAQATNAFLGQAPRFVVEAIGISIIVALAYVLSRQPGGILASLPVLGALALGAARLLPLIQKVYLAWAQYAGNLNVLEDVLSALNLPMDNFRSNTPHTLPFRHEIRLENVSYRYPGRNSPALSNISLAIQKGSRVGIIGKTGSGKSTLMDILMGLLEPSNGHILVDGIIIDTSNKSAWQKHISHVPQHIYLADASITENIALGITPAAINHDKVRRAAEQAQVSEFFDINYRCDATRVGERGIQLSGGQRQRIGIARALYKDADVLVFDEASSALDVTTEAAVMHAIQTLDSNLTVFMIAHRMQTLRNCDLIIQVEDGHLVRMGTFQHVVGDNEATPSG